MAGIGVALGCGGSDDDEPSEPAPVDWVCGVTALGSDKEPENGNLCHCQGGRLATGATLVSSCPRSYGCCFTDAALDGTGGGVCECLDAAGMEFFGETSCEEAAAGYHMRVISSCPIE